MYIVISASRIRDTKQTAVAATEAEMIVRSEILERKAATAADMSTRFPGRDAGIVNAFIAS